ncbi:MAG: molecular chaperone DnaK [Tissierellia bacterium]|nr:molecular chaperone DnaK [Tissierellia bacterium]
MEKEKFSFFQNRLEEEEIKVKNLLERMSNPEEIGFSSEYSTELSSYDNHPADLGTDMFMMEQDKGLINSLEDTIYEIEVSKENLIDGNYGLCKSCGKEIDEERLELIPYLKLCIDCSENKIFLEEKRHFRPEEEDVLTSIRKDINEGIQFDREDSYQAVARFNEVDSDPSFSTGDNQGVFDEKELGVVEDVEKISQEYFDQINK